MSAMTKPTPPALHELEAKVMEQVWLRDRATVREILDAVNAKAAKQLAYTTIMTIMSRLHGKGLLDRERDGRSDVYSARHSRQDYMELRAQTEVQALVEEFGEAALVHFARQVQSLDPERREQLRRMARDG